MLTLPSSDRDLAAEQALLGSLLIDGRAIERVADVVRPDDFDMELHQDMYRAMLDLHRRGRRVDVLLVASALGSQTDEAYLTSLALQVPTSLHVDHYAALVAEQGARGRLSGALTEARRAVQLWFQVRIICVLFPASPPLFSCFSPFNQAWRCSKYR